VEGAFLRTGYVSDAECSGRLPGSVRALAEARRSAGIRGDWQNLPGFSSAARQGATRIWRAGSSSTPSAPLPLAPWSLAGAAVRPAPPGRRVGDRRARRAARPPAAELLQAGAETLLLRLPEATARAIPTPRCSSAPPGAFPPHAALLAPAARRGVHRPRRDRPRALAHGGQPTASARLGDRRGELPALKTALCQRTYRVLCPPRSTGRPWLILSPGVNRVRGGVLWRSRPLGAWALSLPTPPAEALRRAGRGGAARLVADTWRYFERVPDGGGTTISRPTTTRRSLRRARPPHKPDEHRPCAAQRARRARPRLSMRPRRRLNGSPPSLESVERLEKWPGHLFNWYDTRTAATAAAPRYVSTVDSGNLCAALIALRGGLLSTPDVAGRARRRARRRDGLRAALRSEASALHGRAATSTGPGAATAWYDLMASEARLSPLSRRRARGDVPREHWRALSRAQVRADPTRGLERAGRDDVSST
jgi:hypothetical protein